MNWANSSFYFIKCIFLCSIITYLSLSLHLEDLLNEIDPEVVKAALSELVQNLKESERKQEDTAAKVENFQRIVSAMEEEQSNLDSRLRIAHEELNSQREQRRQIEEQINNTNTALTLKVCRCSYCKELCTAVMTL